MATKPLVVQQAWLGIEASHDIAQAFPVSQLAKTHRQEMVKFSQAAWRLGGRELLDGSLELSGKKWPHDLREQRWSERHAEA